MNNEIYNKSMKALMGDSNVDLIVVMNLDIPDDLELEELGSGLDAIFPEDSEVAELSPLSKHLLTVIDEDLAEMKFKHVDFYKNKQQIIARTDSTKAVKYLLENTRNTSIKSRTLRPIESIDDFMIIDTSNIRKEWINDLGIKDTTKDYDADNMKLACVAARQINDIVEVDDVVWVLGQDTNQKIEAVVTILIDKLVASGSKKIVEAVEKHLGTNLSDLARRFLANLNRIK